MCSGMAATAVREQVTPAQIAPAVDNAVTRRLPTRGAELSSLPADQRRMLEKALHDDPTYVRIIAATRVPVGMAISHLRRGLARPEARWGVDDAS